jgi:hypothetical protein
MLDIALAILSGAAVTALALLGVGLFQHRLWTRIASVALGIVAVVLIGLQAYRTSATQDQARAELQGIKTTAGKILGMLDSEKAPPRRIAEPSSRATQRDVDLANQLGDLRHEGRKRYLEWLAGYPNAEQKAESWRLQALTVLDRNYGRAVGSRFNEPTMGEALWAQALSSGITTTMVVLSRVNEHGHRVDRLGQIIEDILAGKIASRH